MRHRDAWLAAMAAALGASEIACNKDAKGGPALAREVPSASASASAPAVAASAPPEETASSAAAPATASASAASSASAKTTPAPTSLNGGIGIGSIGHGACGLAHVNPVCGASTARPEPSVGVMVTANDADAKDRIVLQTQVRNRVRSCANNASRRDPSFHGEVTLQLALDAHGNVTSADVETSTIDEPAMHCMRNAARATKFPEGSARRVRVVIRLQPGA